MTPAEAAALLTIAAAYDNRKPDEDQARAWAMALSCERFEDCRDAVVNHYRRSREWLMPSDVIDGVKAVRQERWQTFIRQHPRGYLTPPRHLDGDPEREAQWIQNVQRRVRDGEVTSPGELDEEDTAALPMRDVESLGLIGRPVPAAAVSRAAHPTHTDTESE